MKKSNFEILAWETIDLGYTAYEVAAGQRRIDRVEVNASFYPYFYLYLYGEAGLRAARRHLSDGGILGVWSHAADSPFATALHRVFDEVQVEPVTVVNDLIDEEQTDWLFFARG